MGGSKGVLGVGSKVQLWAPISLCLCAFLGLDLKTQIVAQIFFADSLLLLEIQAFGGRRKLQKTQICTGNRRFSQKTAGNRRLGSVT